MKADRTRKPRGKGGGAREEFRKPARGPAAGFRKPGRPPERAPAYARAPRRDAGEAADPYRPAHRPKLGVATRPPPRGRGGGFADRAYGERPARGFTVKLDPDVARVFRGDASVNRALRLVMQLLQVVQGPRHAAGGPGQRGFAAGAPPRGVGRRARFDEDESDGTPEE
jgi:hypothetical protein